MIDQVKQVNELRSTLAGLMAAKREASQKWEADNKLLLEGISAVLITLTEAEEGLRLAALAEYKATGNKRPAPGVEIKLFQELKYELSLALAWAVEHSMALSLDRKAFEGICKATEISFVEKVETPKVTLATDLEKALDRNLRKVVS